MIILIILSILTVSCAAVSAADVDDIITDVQSDSINLEAGDSDVDIIKASEADQDSLSEAVDDDPVLGANGPTSSDINDISMYEADADYSENHIYTITGMTQVEKDFLSHFREVSSGYHHNHKQHPANVYFTAVENNTMYMIFYMDEDDYKNMHAFLEFDGKHVDADLYIGNLAGYPKINVARFRGITGTTVNAYFETNRNHGNKIKINGIQILNQTNTTLYINDKFEETVYVGEDATLKAIVTLLNFEDVSVTDGEVSYYLYAVNGTQVLNMSNLPNEPSIGQSVPGGTIQTEKYPVGDYTFIAWYHDDTQAHNFESHSNKVILHVIPLPEVDLGVEKTVNASEVTQDDYVKFTIELTNNGPEKATNIVVNDKLPSGLVFESSEASVGSYDSSSGNWTVPELENGATATLYIIAHVTGVGKLTNTATLTSCRENDTNPNNNVSSADVTSTAKPDVVSVDVHKYITEINGAAYDSANPIYYGDEITYTINVTNHGPDTAHGVNLTDILPDGLEFKSSEASLGSYDSSTGRWIIGDLTDGATATLKIVATINKVGDFTNTAKIDPIEEDISHADDEDSVTETAKPLVDLEITKELIEVNGNSVTDDDHIHYGDEVTFEITVTNNGPCDATGVRLTDKLPDGLEFVSYDASAGSYNQVSGNWNVGDLANDGSATLKIVAKVTKFDETITNIANVTSNEKDNDTTNNKDEESFDSYKITDLAITIEAPSSVLYGETFEFVITVTNNGPCNATEVFATFTLPDEFEYISNNLTDTDYQSKLLSAIELLGETPGFEQSTNTWTIGELNAGDSVQLAVLVKANEVGKFTISAHTEGAEEESDLENNDASTEVEVKPYADLSVEKTVDKTEIKVGETVTYTITVTNNGPFDATGVKVTDSDITKHTFVSASDEANYDSSTGVWTVGDLANGESKTITITVAINEVGEFANTAVVTSDLDDNDTSNNNGSSDNVTVTDVPEEDPDDDVPEEDPAKEVEVLVLPKAGNPLFVLMLSLIVLIGAMFERRE